MICFKELEFTENKVDKLNVRDFILIRYHFQVIMKHKQNLKDILNSTLIAEGFI